MTMCVARAAGQKDSHLAQNAGSPAIRRDSITLHHDA